jgi:hypothetical protein
MRSLVPFAFLTFALVTAQAVVARERTVCLHLRFADARYNCPIASEAGAVRPCNPGGYSDAVGHQVQLWDKDANSPDDLIGTWYLSAGGTQCMTFEWENADYSKGEPEPDVYPRYINIVNRTGYQNYIQVKAVNTDGSDHSATSWRDGQPNDPNRYVASNCRAGAECFIFPSGSIVPTNDRASPRALRIMTLDSAQHGVQKFGELMDHHVKLHYPGRPECTTSCADDRENYHIRDTQGADAILSTHELGHVIQMQEFDQDNLRDDLSKGGGGWNVDGDEFDSGSTTEGFASYMGVVAFYDPNNFATVPLGWSLNFEAAAPMNSTCSANRSNPLQVARAFWDVDDWNNEGGAGAAGTRADLVRYGSEDIVRGWREFANGSGNRQNDESDRDGVNVRDYFANNRNRFIAAGYEETILRHNCLQDQADD